MKSPIVVLLFLVLALPVAVASAGDTQAQKKSDNVKISAKELAEIKRQIRLMRSEMADLEEKIDEITGLHDRVYTNENPSTQEPQQSSHKD